jgi:uncharacterized protein YicC (UPF0701 family)
MKRKPIIGLGIAVMLLLTGGVASAHSATIGDIIHNKVFAFVGQLDTNISSTLDDYSKQVEQDATKEVQDIKASIGTMLTDYEKKAIQNGESAIQAHKDQAISQLEQYRNDEVAKGDDQITKKVNDKVDQAEKQIDNIVKQTLTDK